ncbi:hypothetical protein [Sulfitobacter sp. S190]|uniref:hypothetical protein n=1 Tax=Sulfitobacter sp. S190 TaxID=2867022 RepID=UPI0021A3540E|nr:hypothetical protein [Sulfitobacter sp. S190]UWR21342.1 hypothetical protein K3756_11540 [Sulfitobacter sp. S190]
MAERHRSNDGTRETEKFTDDTAAAAQQGRAGGDLQRDVSTQDERKRATEDPEGTTRVTGEDKRNHGETG